MQHSSRLFPLALERDLSGSEPSQAEHHLALQIQWCRETGCSTMSEPKGSSCQQGRFVAASPVSLLGAGLCQMALKREAAPRREPHHLGLLVVLVSLVDLLAHLEESKQMTAEVRSEGEGQ